MYFIPLKQRVKQRRDLNFALQNKISAHPWKNIDQNSDEIVGIEILNLNPRSDVRMAASSIIWSSRLRYLSLSFSVCKTELVTSASFVVRGETTVCQLFF